MLMAKDDACLHDSLKDTADKKFGKTTMIQAK